VVRNRMSRYGSAAEATIRSIKDTCPLIPEGIKTHTAEGGPTPPAVNAR
jgi:hypothetical protein